MKPRLYSRSHSWKYNGYGFFNKCFKCETTAETNGVYSTEIQIGKSDRLFNVVETGMLIRCKPNHSDSTQFFEIENIKVEKKIATITASHISKSFFNNLVKKDSADGWDLRGTASEVMNKILSNAVIHRNWKDINDVEHSYSNIVDLIGYSNSEEAHLNLELPFTFEEAFFGDNGFIKAFGGEFFFDNEKVYLAKNRGKLKPVKLRFGYGINDYAQEMTKDDMYDVVIAYAKVKGNDDKEYMGVMGYPLDEYNESMDILFGTDFNTHAYYYDVSSFLSSITYEAIGGSLTTESKAQLRESLFTMARWYYNNQGTKISQPSVNVKVTTASQLKKLQDVGLGDSLSVECGNGTIITEKVNKVVYDGLRECYIEHELGEKKISLKDFINLR